MISTNVPLRQDGLPYASYRKVDDEGVAVYFTLDGQQMSFACDRWNKVEHNMHAIVKTIDALRGIARWGTGDMMRAAFTGFAALPSPSTVRSWREIIGVRPGSVTCRRYEQPTVVEPKRRTRIGAALMIRWPN
ncbi:hypothetical protein AWV80_01355 [Cupriavidus sp. UYMU48A]|nr:hypothetical protein AWV80_01355 [Cupriavidus sp. UYMU48A]